MINYNIYQNVTKRVKLQSLWKSSGALQKIEKVIFCNATQPSFARHSRLAVVSVGRAVASNTRGTQFESSQLQNYMQNMCLLLTVENIIIKKRG